MELSGFTAYFIAFADIYKYPLLVVGAIIEGPALMVAVGFLLRMEALSFFPAFLSLVAGDLIGDAGWYYIGYFFAEPAIQKHGHLFGVSAESLEKAKGLFVRYHGRILLISKITMGFGMSLATLMAAGGTRVPFSRYMMLNSLGEFTFVFIMLAIGYFFGGLYGYIADSLRIGFIISVSIMTVLGIYGFTRYMKNKIMQS